MLKDLNISRIVDGKREVAQVLVDQAMQCDVSSEK